MKMKNPHFKLPLLLFCLFSQTLFANSYEGFEKKALIIGNSNYESYPNLPSSKEDTKLLFEKLYDIGFEVTKLEDSKNLTAQIQQFYQTDSDSTVFFLYYSGYIGVDGKDPALVSTDTNSQAAQFTKLSDIIRYPKGANTMNFLMLDWVSLDTQKKVSKETPIDNWENWSGYPKDNFEIQDYITRNFPDFTEKNVLAMYHKSFHRDYAYVKTFVEGIQKEDLSLQDVFNQLEYDIPRTNSIIGSWGKDITKYRSCFPNPESQSSQEAMPPFPFPPLEASAQHVLSKEYFKEGGSLANVNQKLLKAMNLCGYLEKSYYSIPKGFAIVTRIEKIKKDVSSYPPPERWDVEQPKNQEKPFGLWDYLASLFTAKKGTYRIIVFLITPIPFNQSEEKMSMRAAKRYLKGGENKLSEDVGNELWTKYYDCTALIYEFVKPEYEKGKFVRISKYQGLTHLERSNLLYHLK